ncbi:MAG: hypothetical protein QM518_08425, partial [Verrucomicrobiota bacterium]|nr:hypothetical protein [Verrucomicrobiota bacterium]
ATGSIDTDTDTDTDTVDSVDSVDSVDFVDFVDLLDPASDPDPDFLFFLSTDPFPEGWILAGG